MEISKLFCFESKFTSVVLPAPDGEDKITIIPSFDEGILKEDFVNIVIQINGKKRGIVNAQTDTTEENLIKLVNNDDKLLKYLNSGTIKKRIFIKNKLMNIIIQ